MERPIRLLVCTRVGPDLEVLHPVISFWVQTCYSGAQVRYIHQLGKVLHQCGFLRRRVGHGVVVALVEGIPVEGLDLLGGIYVLFHGLVLVVVLGWGVYFGGLLSLLGRGRTVVVAEVNGLGGRLCCGRLGDLVSRFELGSGFTAGFWHGGVGRDVRWR